MLTLVRFGPGAAEPGLSLGADLTRDASSLVLRWTLSGDLDDLVLRPPSCEPARRDGLWQGTCFELFFAIPSEPGYWETNLTPSGDWNVYRFDRYREGMRPEPATAAPTIKTWRGSQTFCLSATLVLPSRAGGVAVLDAGSSAVLEHDRGELSYWALRHPGPQPDFHLRDGFILRI